MRKRIIKGDAKFSYAGEEKELDVKRLAQVEVTSEDTAFPIEEAFNLGSSGWRASEAGRQMIRIIFDEPQQIHRIFLLFEEEKQSRTQEFVLRWSAADAGSFQEIVRQQYNFSPGSASREQEHYTVNLEGVKTVELIITPDINGGMAQASITRLRFS